MLDQINQNPYFGCFEILSLIFLDINFIFPYCLGSIIFFPMIILGYYFLSIIVLGVLFYFILLFWDIILFPFILILCLWYK